MGSGVKGGFAALGIGVLISAAAGLISTIISNVRQSNLIKEGRTLEGQLKTAKKILETSKENVE